MLTSDQVEELEVALKPFAAYAILELTERREWGEIDFKEVGPAIDSVIKIATELLELPLSVLSSDTHRNLCQILPTISTRLKEINNFSLQLSEPTLHRNQLCERIRQESNQLEGIAQSIIPYLRMERGDFKASKEQQAKQAAALDRLLKETKKQTGAFFEDARNKAREQQERTEEVLKNAEAAGARIAVGKFTELFSDEADAQRKRSWAWLSATAAFGLAALASAICFYLNPLLPESASAWQVAGHIGSRAAILAVLFTGAVWCGRVYRALLHQATTNKHRALSLQTFKSFVDATENPEIKDAILLAATNASFGNTTTGLVDQKGSDGFATSLYEAARNLKQGD